MDETTQATQPTRRQSIGSRKEKRKCPTHGEYTATALTIGERTTFSACPECVKAQEADDAALARARYVARLASRADIPLRFQARSFANFREVGPGARRALEVAKRYAERFDSRLRMGGGLVFCGKPGTGKTHLACAIAQIVMAQGRSVRYVTASAAIREFKESYGKGATRSESDVIASFSRPDVLILDEIGMQRGTEFEITMLAEVLNERYYKVRPTILVSNLTEPELATYVGERAIDRMREGGGMVLAFDWPSYRTEVERDASLPWPSVAAVDYSEAG